jgi:hypothetical protein
MMCIRGHCGVLGLWLCRGGGWLVVPMRGRRTILDDVPAVELVLGWRPFSIFDCVEMLNLCWYRGRAMCQSRGE